MCPSYMATREEKHSTRGRANVLRLAMAGRLGESGLADHDVHDVLDLCLECRACKAECPVGVDVARFKSEFLADYWRRHGMPLAHPRDRPRARDVEAGAAVSRRCRTSWRRAASGAGSTRNCCRSIAAGCRRPSRARRSRTASRRDGHRQSGPAIQSASAVRNRHVRDRRSLQRHVHELQPSGSRRGRRRGARGGGHRRPPRAAWLLRPAADFAGAAGRSARSARRRTRTRCSTSRRAASAIVFLEPSCLSAIRDDAPALLRGERAAPGADGRGCVRAVRGLRRAGMAGRADSPGPQDRAVDACCCTAIAIRRRWA